MPDAIAAGRFPVLTLLTGYGTKSLSDWIQDRRTREREREARDAASFLNGAQAFSGKRCHSSLAITPQLQGFRTFPNC